MGKIGMGVLFQYEDILTPGTYFTLAEVHSFSGGGLKAAAVENTHTESPDNYQEFIKGLKNGGELGVEVAWLPEDATQDELTGWLAEVDADRNTNVRCVWPGGRVAQFNVVATDCSPAAQIADLMMASLGMTVSGKPDLDVTP